MPAVSRTETDNHPPKGTHLRIHRLICAAAIAAGVSAAPLAANAAAATLTGAGSTLIAPLENEWAAAWGAATGNKVIYSSVGSGTGEKDAAAGSVTFGASDAPAAAFPGSCGGCKFIPWALTATGVGYNVPGAHFKGHNNSGLKLTGAVLAEIYTGQITNWDDPAIKRLNKGVRMPNLRIAVFYRSDGSGDSYAFTNYLSKVSATFRSKVGGASVTPTFPVGVGEKGNSGVASAVKANPGGIGYISASYLIAQGISTAYVQNRHHYYAPPGLANIAAAASGPIDVTNPDIQNAPQKYAYPISTFTNVIVPANPTQVSLLQSFVQYDLTTARATGEGIDFAPIPKSVQQADLAAINSI
jgi:phosphate transport system substrate-binding protein